MAPGADIARLRVDGDAAGLYRAVDSDDSATAYGAVALLGDLAAGDAAAVGLLLEIVRRPDVFRIGLRLRAASALGELREPRAVPALLAMLSPPERGTAEDVRRRRAVVGALARIGTPTVVTELIRRAAAGIDSPWVLPHALTRLRARRRSPRCSPRWTGCRRETLRRGYAWSGRWAGRVIRGPGPHCWGCSGRSFRRRWCAGRS
ncbi:HEAT repeat domain-containing protein [Streptomyces clavuligerus]|uniref:HEAT repeat domain-containing protein n=1 Tax=Streptomyces clavuligerus TaxID=1901 RepID=UPI001E5ABBC6|nr:HEAT repeat domain-containing protein [Streptomyces clavuligerus]